MDLARGQAYLVAIGRVALGRRGHQLALGQLARQRLGHRNRGVSCARDAHGLIHVSTPAQRVTDSAPDAGGCTAEGLYLSGMVVGLVLEEVEPILLFPAHIHLDPHRAGVDLLGFVQARELTGMFEIACADGAHIHETYRLLLTP